MVLLKGIVTKVQSGMLSFTVNNETKVHLILLFLKNGNQVLPEVDTSVELDSDYFHQNGNVITSLIATPGSKFDFELGTPPINNDFLNCVKLLELSEDKLRELCRIFDRVYENYKHVTEEALFYLLLKVTNSIPYNLQFLKDLKYVGNSCLDNYKDFSYLFGNHYNWSRYFRKQYLVGFLSISSKTGLLYLNDINRKIPCFILKSDHSIDYYDQSYVLIEEFYYITEVYSSKNSVCNQEYLIVNDENVTPLDCKQKEKEKVFPMENPACHCIVMSKFLPIMTAPNTIEYWLEISVQEKRSFLQISAENHGFLEVGKGYSMFCRNSSIKAYNKEIYKLTPSLLQYQSLSETQFSLENSETSLSQNLTASEAKKMVGQTANLVSFEGVILVKKFMDSLGSRTQSFSNSSDFGTPGHKTHCLEFETEDQPLTLYLNNWENHLCPFGLIPQMRVLVCNVVAQSGKYYKSTVMTSVRILAYEPNIKFETANLYNYHLGFPFFFGLGKSIPNGVLIYGKILLYHVLGIKIDTFSNNLTVTITIIVEDNFGESKVIAKSEDFLHILFGTYTPVFLKWCNAIKESGRFVLYSTSNFNSHQTNNSKLKLLQEFCKNQLNGNKRSVNLKWLCKKMETQSNGTPVYFFLSN